MYPSHWLRMMPRYIMGGGAASSYIGIELVNRKGEGYFFLALRYRAMVVAMRRIPRGQVAGMPTIYMGGVSLAMSKGLAVDPVALREDRAKGSGLIFAIRADRLLPERNILITIGVLGRS